MIKAPLSFIIFFHFVYQKGLLRYDVKYRFCEYKCCAIFYLQCVSGLLLLIFIVIVRMFLDEKL